MGQQYGTVKVTVKRRNTRGVEILCDTDTDTDSGISIGNGIGVGIGIGIDIGMYSGISIDINITIDIDNINDASTMRFFHTCYLTNYRVFYWDCNL